MMGLAITDVIKGGIQVSSHISASEMPLISIIVPVYNKESLVGKCIESLITQTYRNIEIILVNDGSTDNSGVICDEYALKDARIRVVHLAKNEGVSHARNTGIDMARGDYFGFADSDDYANPMMYEVLYRILSENAADISICAFYKDVNGEILGNDIDKTVVYTGEEAAVVISAGWNAHMDIAKPPAWTGKLNFAVWSCLYKRSLIADTKFEERSCSGEDYGFALQVMKRTKTAAVTGRALYYYAMWPNSLSHTRRTKEQIFGVVLSTDMAYDAICFMRDEYQRLAVNNLVVRYFAHIVRALQAFGYKLKGADETLRHIKAKFVQIRGSDAYLGVKRSYRLIMGMTIHFPAALLLISRIVVMRQGK
jgi:glycosyltransferase involved in cell wall biosynthesis